MKKALPLGILASAFFAATFILNRCMNLTGGYWLWGACLRYLFMLPMLFLVLLPGKKFLPVLRSIRSMPGPWFTWSIVGFGFFYVPLCLASVFGESWMTAASWQITIVAGILLTPLTGKAIPKKNLLCAALIFVGVMVLQIPNFRGNDIRGNCLALIPILIAAFCYPLGNRKMMQHCPADLGTMQRVFGMTLCSMPVWIISAVAAAALHGIPSGSQLLQSASVALFSGIIATGLFFHATDIVRDQPKHLALVEAAQCGEVIFTLIGGVLFLGDALPGMFGWIGLAMIVVGMVINSLVTASSEEE